MPGGWAAGVPGYQFPSPRRRRRHGERAAGSTAQWAVAAEADLPMGAAPVLRLVDEAAAEAAMPAAGQRRVVQTSQSFSACPATHSKSAQCGRRAADQCPCRSG